MTTSGLEESRVADLNVLRCQHCGAETLSIRELKGVETVLFTMTGLRKYECDECGGGFRAGDRRRFHRTGKYARKVVRKTFRNTGA